MIPYSTGGGCGVLGGGGGGVVGVGVEFLLEIREKMRLLSLVIQPVSLLNKLFPKFRYTKYIADPFRKQRTKVEYVRCITFNFCH